jgi:hypothetical protein
MTIVRQLEYVASVEESWMRFAVEDPSATLRRRPADDRTAA